MADNVIKSLARNQTRDQPALVFFELVGNDVCHPEPTLDAMTTPQEFYVNILGKQLL
jgi:acyloxyacyl hydrolase